MSDFEYIVMTPPYHRGSAGVRFLNELTDHIRSTGRKAHKLYSLTTTVGLGISLDCETWYKSEPDAIKHFTGNPDKYIVIHGENQDCANFMGMNVARYYLNRIGALRKVGIPREGEFKIAWDETFCDDPDFILRAPTVRYPLNAALDISLVNRQVDVTYIGKGKLKYPNIARIPDTIELRRDWPNNDDEYFYLLKNTRYLYTYDIVSSVINDAITLGALPVVMLDKTETFQRAKSSLFGCIAHVDDDMEQAKEDFVFMRPLYIQMEQQIAANYQQNLDACCSRMEQYFGGA